jgi:multidrug efflux pump subunit AcrB
MQVRDVQLDWNDPVRALKVQLDQDKARALGLTPADVFHWTRPGSADGPGHRARDRAAHAQRVLRTDGDRDHGRSDPGPISLQTPRG